MITKQISAGTKRVRRKLLKVLLRASQLVSQEGRARDSVAVGLGKVPLPAEAIAYPTPAVLGGTVVDGNPNYIALGSCGSIALSPPILYIGLTETHHSTRGIRENGTFSVNVPSSRLVGETDLCGCVSGRTHDKSKLFGTFYGTLQTAPMIQECPVNMECRVVREVRLHGRVLFFGEVVQLYADESCVTEGNAGKPVLGDLHSIDPILWGQDNHYYKIGDVLGQSYSIGKRLKSRLK